MLLLSVPAGSIAYQSSRRAIIGTWMADHGPARSTWRHALGARGFESIDDAELVRRASRTLPTLAERPGAAWISSDGAWICVFPRNEEELAPRFYSTWRASELAQAKGRRGKRRPSDSREPKLADLLPSAWEAAGRSWPEFEALLERLDRHPPVQRAAAKAEPASGRGLTAKRPTSDPRELLF